MKVLFKKSEVGHRIGPIRGLAGARRLGRV